MICRRCKLPIYRDGDLYRHAGSERVPCRDGQGDAEPEARLHVLPAPDYNGPPVAGDIRLRWGLAPAQRYDGTDWQDVEPNGPAKEVSRV